MEGLRAGSARVSLEPPLGLPMVGFVRQWQPGSGYGMPLEATALVLESGDTRVALVGVDTVGIQSPEVDDLRARVGAALGTPAANVLLNFSHTHLGPPGGRSLIGDLAQVDDRQLAARIAAYVDVLHEKVVSVARLAAAALEPARVVWGLGSRGEAVNRRERTADGRVILGWRPDGLVDTSVPVLQARRPDESPICTLVGYGCHTVATGPEVTVYSADFAGMLRSTVREWTGGECVYFQAAAGNVLPRVAFTDSEDEAARMGRALGLEAVHAVSRRSAWPFRYERLPGGSVTPFSLYRPTAVDPEPQPLAAAEERVTFPLLPLPSLDEVRRLREEFERAVAEADAGGADPGVLRTLRYNSRWARLTEQQIADGRAPTQVEATLSAVRVGNGAIVVAPGEIFSEIGLAVKERSPAEVTLYAGYTNGLVSYFPTAEEYPLGGYEPGYGNRTFGLPAQVAPDCERILVETGARLACRLFPERPAPAVEGWLATGALPAAPEDDRHERPPGAVSA
jgi:neutral ceramidase